MSATIYKALKWCTLGEEKIREVLDRIMTGFIYKGEDFYNEVEKLNGWKPAGEEDDGVLIWDVDDAGPIKVDGNELGLFIHFDDDARKYDWACIYEI